MIIDTDEVGAMLPRNVVLAVMDNAIEVCDLAIAMATSQGAEIIRFRRDELASIRKCFAEFGR